VKRLAFLSLIVFLSACALLQRKIEVVPWPPDVSYLEGEGEIDIAWKKERFSGSFAVKMEYPDMLLLEVYGPFGQTLLHLKKDRDSFLFVAGGEKTTDETVFRDRYGFGTRDLIDDLAMKGPRQEAAEGWVTERERYRVVYANDRKGAQRICWKNGNDTICLTFSEAIFQKP